MWNGLLGGENALLITEELLVFATVVGSVAALPAFIEFVSEFRKRKERINLSLEEEPVSALTPRLAGMDDLLESIADLVDRARNPAAYQDLKIGNEVLIIGPNQSGKKSLAQSIAKMAGMEHIITVYNTRDSDALAKAKSIVRSYKRQKVMLLLPRIDLAYKHSDPELLTELDALIESTSELQNVLVIATAVFFEPDSELDNTFGIKISLPGAAVVAANRPDISQDMQRVLAEVARFYLADATRRGFRVAGMTEDVFCTRVLDCVANPAEIEDVVVLCETTALYRKRTGKARDLIIDETILQTAIHRVVVG
jgi:hypothetical protein